MLGVRKPARAGRTRTHPFLEAEMSPLLPRRPSLLAPLALAALAACQDSTAPRPGLRAKAHFAQGDNNTWTVNTLADPSAGANVCDETECTIREAILAAAPGGTIVFAGGLQGSINLDTGGGFLQISKDLTIDGAGRITLDAKGAPNAATAALENAWSTRERLTPLRCPHERVILARFTAWNNPAGSAGRHLPAVSTAPGSPEGWP